MDGQLCGITHLQLTKEKTTSSKVGLKTITQADVANLWALRGALVSLTSHRKPSEVSFKKCTCGSGRLIGKEAGICVPGCGTRAERRRVIRRAWPVSPEMWGSLRRATAGLTPWGVSRKQVDWSSRYKVGREGCNGIRCISSIRQQKHAYFFFFFPIVPLSSRAWVILKWFLEKGLLAKVNWIPEQNETKQPFFNPLKKAEGKDWV